MNPRPTSPAQTQISDLPSGMLSLILEKVTGEIDDILSCAGVCLSWRSVMGSLNNRFKRSRPILILREKPSVGFAEKEPSSSQQYLHIFDTASHKSHAIHLPQLSKQWYHGCSNGWLLTIATTFPHETRLLNPITQSQVMLPSLGVQFERGFRVITSSPDPSHPDCVVLGAVLEPMKSANMYRHNLLFWNSVNEAWKKVMVEVELDGIMWHDIILHKNQFYAVSNKFLYRISLDGHAKKLIALPPIPQGIPPPLLTSFYLLEFNGELHLVVMRLYKGLSYLMELLKFDVEKIWIQIEDLDDNAIYLSKAHSVVGSVEEGLKNSVISCPAAYLTHRVVVKHGTQGFNVFPIPKLSGPVQWFTL